MTGHQRHEGVPMSNTIEITEGVVESTTRMWLKREMERFGQVEVCHMGNRQNPKGEPPWVRFASSKSAEQALDAIKKGEVFVDGIQIKAERSNKRGPPLVPREPRDMECGSRDLFLNSRAGGKRRGRSPSRKKSSSSRSCSRSRRGGKRSRSRRRSPCS